MPMKLMQLPAHHYERADCADVVQECWPHAWNDVPLPCPRGQLRRRWRLVGQQICNDRVQPMKPPRAPRTLRILHWGRDDRKQNRFLDRARRRRGYVADHPLRASVPAGSISRIRRRCPRSGTTMIPGLGRRDHCLPSSPPLAYYLRPQRLAWRRMVRIPRARRQRLRRRRLVDTTSSKTNTGQGTRTCRC